MHSLFTVPDKNQATISSPKHNYITNRFEEAITRATYTYRRTPYFVEADHILVKIIQQVGLGFNPDSRRFYEEIYHRVSRIATAVGFTDYSAKVGSATKNSFFSPTVSEYIIAVSNGYTSLIDSPGGWMDFSPVQVMYHPYDSFSFNIREGSRTSQLSGRAVIKVDIPLLVIQYHKWRNWAKTVYPVMPTIEQFVFQFPLVNMLSSDIEVCYLNRIASSMLGKSASPESKMYSFTLPDISTGMSEDMNYILDSVIKKPRNIVDLADSIVLLRSKTIKSFLELPRLPISSANAGILALANLPWISLLSQLSFQSKSHDNTTQRQYLSKRFRELKSSGAFRGIRGLPESVFDDLFDKDILPYIS